MKYCYLLVLILMLGCNPIPQKDKYPEVPELTSLLQDKTKFKKIVDISGLSEIIILNEKRIFLKPDHSRLPFKIIEPNGKIVFEHVYDWKLPFYIDKHGNLYFNRKKFFYPNYQKQTDFKNIVFADSLNKKSQELQNLNDSLRLKALDAYEVTLLKPYGLKPCKNTLINPEDCDVFKIVDQTLVVRNTLLFKSELSITKSKIPKFDDDVLVGWRNGRLPSPDYLAYHELHQQKFKCDKMVAPTTVSLNGKLYLFAAGLGLYQVLF